METEKRRTDLEARKRDHKVQITEEAIEKIPLIRYRTIPEKYDITIREIAREVLKIAKEQNDSNEVAIVYSLEWEKLSEKGRPYMGISLGDEHSVDPAENPTSYHLIHSSVRCVVICMHNHPNLSKISLDDVKFFLKYENVKMLAAITNLGSVSYISKPEDFDWDAAINLFNEAVSIHNLQPNNLKNAQKAADYFLSHCKRVNIVYDDR